MDRGVVTKSQKGRKVSVERKVGECCQWKAIGQCSKGDSCSFSHDQASGSKRDQRQEGQPPSLAPRPKVQAAEDGSLLEQDERFRGRKFLRGQCAYTSCNYGTLSCVSITSLNQDAHVTKECRFRHVEVDGQPSRKSKTNDVKDQLLC